MNISEQGCCPFLQNIFGLILLSEYGEVGNIFCRWALGCVAFKDACQYGFPIRLSSHRKLLIVVTFLFPSAKENHLLIYLSWKCLSPKPLKSPIPSTTGHGLVSAIPTTRFARLSPRYGLKASMFLAQKPSMLSTFAISVSLVDGVKR
jgi:hypothetical protein